MVKVLLGRDLCELNIFHQILRSNKTHYDKNCNETLWYRRFYLFSNNRIDITENGVGFSHLEIEPQISVFYSKSRLFH